MALLKRKRIRSDGPYTESNWTVQFTVLGRKYSFATPFTERREAAQWARKRKQSIKIAALSGQDEKLRALSPRCRDSLTVAELVSFYYRSAPVLDPAIKEHTLKANDLRLRAILRDVFGKEAEHIPFSELNGAVINQWKEIISRRVGELDPVARQQKLRSANSSLRQARSIFSRQLRAHYAERWAVVIPAGLTGFISAPAFPKVDKSFYRAPDDATLQRTFAALTELESRDPNAFLACWLALGFGLRASEIAQARCGWFSVRDGAVWLDGDIVCKNREAPRVRAQFQCWSKIGSRIEHRPPGDYVLMGEVTERGQDVCRRISIWMKSLGWQTTHHLHELRAFAGSKVCDDQGLDAAQAFLRHRSRATTERCYMHHRRTQLKETLLPGF